MRVLRHAVAAEEEDQRHEAVELPDDAVPVLVGADRRGQADGIEQRERRLEGDAEPDLQPLPAFFDPIPD